MGKEARPTFQLSPQLQLCRNDLNAIMGSESERERDLSLTEMAPDWYEQTLLCWQIDTRP